MESHPDVVVTKEEQEVRDTSALLTKIENIVARERQSWEAGLAEQLEHLSLPLRDEVPTETREAPTRSPFHVPHPNEWAYERIYREHGDELRQWRKPEIDHWAAEWIRGDFYKNHAQKALAVEKLDGLCPQFRADTLEGVAGADGAISTGTGGALIPRPLEQAVMIARDRVAKMRRFANSFTMTRQTHTLPTAGAMTAAMAGEATTAAQGEGTFAEVQFTAKKGQVKAVASLEMLEDAAVQLVSIYTQRAGGALGVLEDNQFFADGDGAGNNISSKLDGTAYAETTATFLGYLDVVGIYYSVPQVYRDNGIWLASPNVLQFMTNLADDSGGAGLGRPFYVGLTDQLGAITDDRGQQGTILRRPVFEVPFGDGFIGFGDVRAAYTIGTRQGITVSSSEHFLFDTQRVMWLFTQRFDGNDVDAVAFQKAAGITSATTARS
jgi:HK97 family phage major capsid protein